MSSSKFSYPHPILGNFDDILPELKEDCVKAETVTDDNNHYYQFVMTIEDPTILDLIAQNKAKYAVRYKCKITLFEGIEYSQDNSNKVIVVIPRKEVIEKIDFQLFVIATESFTYSNPAANPIFMGSSFDVHKNDPLVFFPDQWDNLDVTYHTLKHYSSILRPIPDENLEGDDISVSTEEIIEIHVSKDVYSKLHDVNKPENAEEVISSYVQTALLTALFQLFYEKNIDDIRDDDRAWVQAIIKRMSEEPNMPSLEDVVDYPAEYVPSLVQKLLQFPMGALLNKLATNADVVSTDSNTVE